MRDVAREAGISVASVSRILSGDADKFADTTVARVREVARTLNYRPNATARSLATGSTRMAGVMIPLGDFYGSIVDGLNEALLQHGHLMLHAWNPRSTTPADDPTEALIIHQMIERAVDGVILRPSSEEFERSYFEEIWQRGIPLITVDRQMALFQSDFVGTDDVRVGEDAARCLLRLGHRRLLFVGAPGGVSTSRLRGQGMRQVVSETLNAACSQVALDWSMSPAPQLQRVLSGPDRPTGVFCYSDNEARVFCQAVRSCGLRIPEDISVIGCGNLSFGRESSPALTSFDQYAHQIGARAAELYLERINPGSLPTAPRTILVPATLIERGTTARRPPSSTPAGTVQLPTTGTQA
jgi:LacI family transcriptional regulator